MFVAASKVLATFEAAVDKDTKVLMGVMCFDLKGLCLALRWCQRCAPGHCDYLCVAIFDDKRGQSVCDIFYHLLPSFHRR